MSIHFIDQFTQYAKSYIEGLPDNPVFPTPTAIQHLEKLDTPLQEESLEVDAVLALLEYVGSPATVKSTGGRYYGFVTGGCLPAALSAKLMASVWDQNAAMTVMSPVASRLEMIAGKWLLSLFGLPADCGFEATGDITAI